ncbi:MAG: hypothetical protein Ct9H300mP25_08700 [Acidobacteriota bacterium]|nr:MAG: hypothetical protein Ct9H300mP25_08700 [Acidobacteriota bacterium]
MLDTMHLGAHLDTIMLAFFGPPRVRFIQTEPPAELFLLGPKYQGLLSFCCCSQAFKGGVVAEFSCHDQPVAEARIGF